MRKLLLIGLVALGVACQKDYYLQDLNDANARIEALQGQLNDLSVELQKSVDEVRVTAEALAEANETISNLTIELEDVIDNFTFVNESQSNFIHELNARIVELETIISELNADILVLEGKLADALEQDELDVELIESLTNQIAVLEAREPEVIIEYITVVETIIETVVIDNTDTTRISELETEVANLKAQLNALLSDDTYSDDYVSYGDWTGEDAGFGAPVVTTDVVTGTAGSDAPTIEVVTTVTSVYEGYTYIQTRTGEIIVLGAVDTVAPVIGDLERVVTVDGYTDVDVTVEVIDNPDYVGVVVTFADVQNTNTSRAYTAWIGLGVTITFDTGQDVSAHSPGDDVIIIINGNEYPNTVQSASGGKIGILVQITDEFAADIDSGAQVDLAL